jgi:outer membrane protein OmpA-like peptidoglycan-associated protein
VRTEVQKSETRTEQQLQTVDRRLETIERDLGEEKARLGTLDADIHRVRLVAEETARQADQTRELVAKATAKAEAAAPDAPQTVNRTPPPQTPETVAAAPETMVIHFGFGQWELNNSARLALVKALKRLRENPALVVRLEGHADNIGRPSENLELSQRRADEVRRFLVGAGVKRNRIEAVAIGEARPIASNRSKTGRDQNRRVAITLLPAK